MSALEDAQLLPQCQVLGEEPCKPMAGCDPIVKTILYNPV